MRDAFTNTTTYGAWGADGFGCCGCPSELGDLGIVVPFTKEWSMMNAARKQTAAAMILKDLASYKDAANANLFMQIPGSRSDAHFHAAYWMAVAARILKDKSLAAYAYRKMTWAYGQAQTPGSTMLFRGTPEDIRQIMGYAATKIAEEAAKDGQTGNPNIKSILAIVGHHASPGAAESGREHRQAQSPAGQVIQTLTEPPDEPEGMPTWLKVVLVVGGVAVVGGVIYGATRGRKGEAKSSPLAGLAF